jgi:hypothetical protein
MMKARARRPKLADVKSLRCTCGAWIAGEGGELLAAAERHLELAHPELMHGAPDALDVLTGPGRPVDAGRRHANLVTGRRTKEDER